MIKNPDRYRIEAKEAREAYLRGLTVEDSVRLLENLLRSRLLEEFKFSEDRPMSLALSIRNARKRV